MTSPISCSACQYVLGIDEWRALEKGQLNACPACGAPMQPGQPGQPGQPDQSTGTDDTGAFQRFYSSEAQTKTGVGQRFMAWWREHVKGVRAR